MLAADGVLAGCCFVARHAEAGGVHLEGALVVHEIQAAGAALYDDSKILGGVLQTLARMEAVRLRQPVGPCEQPLGGV